MFEKLSADVAIKIIEKLAMRSNPTAPFNKRDADRRALFYLSTDREGTSNALRSSMNATLGCNNADRAAIVAKRSLTSSGERIYSLLKAMKDRVPATSKMLIDTL